MEIEKRVKEMRNRKGVSSIRSDFLKIQSREDMLSPEKIENKTVNETVNALTRFILLNKKTDVFFSLLQRAAADELMGKKNAYSEAKTLVHQIHNNDTQSIRAACMLTGNLKADEKTASHIREMVNRSIRFLKGCGPVINPSMFFAPDLGLCTSDTMWIISTQKNEMNDDDLKLLLSEWNMQREFLGAKQADIINIGIYYPRTDTAYFCLLSQIPKNLILSFQPDQFSIPEPDPVH